MVAWMSIKFQFVSYHFLMLKLSWFHDSFYSIKTAIQTCLNLFFSWTMRKKNASHHLQYFLVLVNAHLNGNIYWQFQIFMIHSFEFLFHLKICVLCANFYSPQQKRIYPLNLYFIFLFASKKSLKFHFKTVFK